MTGLDTAQWPGELRCMLIGTSFQARPLNRGRQVRQIFHSASPRGHLTDSPNWTDYFRPKNLHSTFGLTKSCLGHVFLMPSGWNPWFDLQHFGGFCLGPTVAMVGQHTPAAGDLDGSLDESDPLQAGDMGDLGDLG